MSFSVSQEGVNFIAGHEGEVLTAYKCPAGKWTIGVGHTAAAGAPKVKPGMTITRAQSRRILAQDLAKFERRVNDSFDTRSQHEFDGAVSFDFNCGTIAKASWVEKWNAGDREGALKGIMAWNKARDRTGKLRVLKGLTRRRREERDLIAHGRYTHTDTRTGEETMLREPAEIDKDLYHRKLKRLGFTGEDRVVAFQRQHKRLANDGILGPATAAQIDRVLDYKKKQKQDAGGVAAGGGAAAVGGQAPEWLFYLLIAVAAAAVLWLGWRAWLYRDEIKLSMRRLRPE
jgi:lysozyme